MHDFGTLAYMDMHKTGSSLTSQFLKTCCLLDEKAFTKHKFLDQNRNPETFYFTTVRNPLSAYISLFRYGLDGKGGYFQRMTRKGYGRLYRADADAFHEWLDLTLQPAHMAQMYGGLAKLSELGFGLQSARHVLFSLEKPKKKMHRCNSMKQALAVFERGNINSLVLRSETLNAGLMDLATRILPDAFDQSRAQTFFADRDAVRTNQSFSQIAGDIDVDGALGDQLYAREKLIFDRYYGGKSALTR